MSIRVSSVGGASDSSYRLLLRSSGNISTAAAAGNKYALLPNGTANNTAPAIASAGNSLPWIVYLDDADYTVSGRTLRLRLRGVVATSSANSAVTYTVGLYPLTVSGTNAALGTVVSGSTCTIVTPLASTINSSSDQADFACPADGAYCIGVTVDGTPGTNANVQGSLTVHTS